MSQFAPGETKTAIAPITARPAGLACEAELFLGPDELTKVASSGRVPFVSTGARQNVSLPITMPSEEGTYHGYIDVFAEGVRFLAYKTVENIVIALPPEEMNVDGLIISTIGGKKLYNVGIDADGLLSATLSEPLEVTKLSGISLGGRYEGPPHMKEIYSGIIFHLWYEPTWPADYPCNSPPAFMGPYSVSTYCVDPPDCTTYRWIVPFDVQLTIRGLFGDGYYCPGIYDGILQYSLLFGDIWGWTGVKTFRIKNMVRCTGKGEVTIP